ncbi:MAG TPA: GspH/FimT family pseudopilin [Rhodocyclaceae bacterium]
MSANSMAGEGGFSLIELMVVIAIAAILLGLGLSGVNTMLVNNKVRAKAESIFAGLQMARAEAIRRNAPMRFALLDSLTASCAPAASGQFWAVTQTDQVSRGVVTGYCESLPYVPPDRPDPCNPNPGICPATDPNGNDAANKDCRPIGNPVTCTNDPWIAYKSGGIASSDATVAATTSSSSGAAAAVITFGPIGQVLTNFDSAAPLGFVLVSPTSDTRAKRWAIRIGSGNGSLKFCDPDKSSPDPMAC